MIRWIGGLRGLCRHLRPGGVFVLWSNEPPDVRFTELLQAVFNSVQAHEVEFYNPFLDDTASNSVYVARL